MKAIVLASFFFLAACNSSNGSDSGKENPVQINTNDNVNGKGNSNLFNGPQALDVSAHCQESWDRIQRRQEGKSYFYSIQSSLENSPPLKQEIAFSYHDISPEQFTESMTFFGHPSKPTTSTKQQFLDRCKSSLERKLPDGAKASVTLLDKHNESIEVPAGKFDAEFTKVKSTLTVSKEHEGVMYNVTIEIMMSSWANPEDGMAYKMTLDTEETTSFNGNTFHKKSNSIQELVSIEDIKQ